MHASLQDPNGFFHILFNMIGLFVFGRDVELRYGRQEMLRFYLLAVMVSGAAWLLIQILTHQSARFARWCIGRGSCRCYPVLL